MLQLKHFARVRLLSAVEDLAHVRAREIRQQPKKAGALAATIHADLTAYTTLNLSINAASRANLARRLKFHLLVSEYLGPLPPGGIVEDLVQLANAPAGNITISGDETKEPPAGDISDAELRWHLMAAMVDAATEAKEAGDAAQAQATLDAMHELSTDAGIEDLRAALAKAKAGTQNLSLSIEGATWLSWEQRGTTTGGTKRWYNSATKKYRYQTSEPGHRIRRADDHKIARGHLARIRDYEDVTEEHIAEMADKLPSLTMPQLRSVRSWMGGRKVGGGQLKEGLVKAIREYAGKYVEEYTQRGKANDEWEAAQRMIESEPPASELVPAKDEATTEQPEAAGTPAAPAQEQPEAAKDEATTEQPEAAGTFADAEKALVAHASRQTYTVAAKGALEDYRSGISDDLNAALRSGKPPTDRDSLSVIRGVDEAFQAAQPLEQPIKTFRGLSFDSPDKHAAAVARYESALASGQPITDAGYVSTTIDPAKADEFASGHGKKSNGVVIEIINARHGIYMESLGGEQHVGEKEFLMPRDGQFRVVGKGQRMVDGKPVTTYQMEQVSPDSAAPAAGTSASVQAVTPQRVPAKDEATAEQPEQATAGDNPAIADTPKPPSPGFTGVDANGHHWVNGEQVAKPEEPTNARPDELESDNRAGGAKPVDGRLDGGSDGRDAGQRGARPAGPRVITVRSEFTKAGNTGLVPAALKPHLNDAQQQGVALAVEAISNHGGFLLADGTGVGKTRQMLGTAQAFLDKGKKVIVVAPAEVIKPDWTKGTMTGSWAADGEKMGVGTKLAKGGAPLASGVVNVTSYNELGKIKDHIDKDTIIIFDESHAMKNRSSARFKHGKDASDKAGGVMYATATPGDKPLHIAHLARAGVFGNAGTTQTYEKLGMKLTEQRIHGGKTITVWKVDPKVGYKECARRMTGLFDQMTKDGLMVKRELSMDGVGFQTDHTELSDDQHVEIQKVHDDVFAKTGNKAVALMAARLHQEPMKIPAAVRSIQEELAAGRSPVLFLGRVNDIGDADEESDDADKALAATGHTSEGTAKALKRALMEAGIAEADIGELHGGAASTTPAAKKKTMEAFQANRSKVMIATIQSGGTGINLDDTTGDRPRTLIMMTPPFTANDMAQAVGRIHRLNTASDSKIRGMLSDTAIDHWNAAVLAKKFEMLGATAGGDIQKGAGAIGVAPPELSDNPQEPFAWGESLQNQPKHYYNTPFGHNDLISKFGGKRVNNGGNWTTSFPSQEHFDRYKNHVLQQQTEATQTPVAKLASNAPIDPSRHGFIKNKFDTWSNGKRVPAGKGWVKRGTSGGWVGYTHDDAVKRIGGEQRAAAAAAPAAPAAPAAAQEQPAAAGTSASVQAVTPQRVPAGEVGDAKPSAPPTPAAPAAAQEQPAAAGTSASVQAVTPQRVPAGEVGDAKPSPTAARRLESSGWGNNAAFGGDAEKSAAASTATRNKLSSSFADQLQARGVDSGDSSPAEKLGLPKFDPANPEHAKALHDAADAIRKHSPGATFSEDRLNSALSKLERAGGKQHILHKATRQQLLDTAHKILGAVADQEAGKHLNSRTVTSAPPTPAAGTSADAANAIYRRAIADREAAIPHNELMRDIDTATIGKSKADLVAMAESMEIVGTKTKSQATIAAAIKQRILDVRSQHQRRRMIEDDDSPAPKGKGMAGMKHIKDLPGSTQPKLMEDAGGSKWVVKSSGNTSQGHIESEVQADELYRAMGIGVPYSSIQDNHKVAEFVPNGKSLNEWERTAGVAQKKKMHAEISKGFVMDALLGNWDVLGQDRDNILVADDVPHRIDNGGALAFRAQGQPKGDKWGPKVTELQTLRDPKINSHADVYSGLTDADIKAQIQDVVKNRGKILEAAKDPAIRKMLEQRIDHLAGMKPAVGGGGGGA